MLCETRSPLTKTTRDGAQQSNGKERRRKACKTFQSPSRPIRAHEHNAERQPRACTETDYPHVETSGLAWLACCRRRHPSYMSQGAWHCSQRKNTGAAVGITQAFSGGLSSSLCVALPPWRRIFPTSAMRMNQCLAFPLARLDE